MANLDEQVHAAKAYLLETSAGSDSNLYDHLTDCLSKLLDEKPVNSLGSFEEISRSVKRERLRLRSNIIQESQDPSNRVELAILQKPLFAPSEEDEGDDADEEVVIPFPNLLEVMGYFQQGGVGLSQDECFRIMLALKQLPKEFTKEFTVSSVRFWGKVFGTEANYIIAEAEIEGEEEEEEEEEEQTKEGGEEGDSEDEEGEEKDEPPPKSEWKPPLVIPKEEPKTGTNKKTYFVCNKPGDRWSKLPHVKPAEIVAARNIRKAFTGILSSPVISYPPFPGREENYLRAQIARISATTHISPSGYFQQEEDEEEQEEGEGPGPIEVNNDFEINKISEYTDGLMNNWTHHVEYILPQGRCQWFNPVQKAEDEFDEGEEDDDDDEKEQPYEPEPESGPQLLTSAGVDSKVDGMPAWSARVSSNTIPQYAVAIVSSNLWPGAHAFAAGRKFENVYIGFGLKYNSTPFNPILPPTVQQEFPDGADITETTDPTVEQENALKKSQEEKENAQEEEEEPEDSDDD